MLQLVRRLLRRGGGGHGGHAKVGNLFCVHYTLFTFSFVQVQEGRGQGEGGAQGTQQDPARPHRLQDPGLHLPRVKI